MGKPVASIPIAMIHFGEIVIFGGKPEYGDGVDALFCDLFGAADGRKRLINAIGWPGEESHLLPGNDGDGPCGQPVQIAGRFRAELASRKRRVFLAQYGYKRAPRRWFEANLTRCRSYTGKGRRMGVIARNQIEIFQK
jgi:hypothetical protein